VQKKTKKNSREKDKEKDKKEIKNQNIKTIEKASVFRY